MTNNNSLSPNTHTHTRVTNAWAQGKKKKTCIHLYTSAYSDWPASCADQLAIHLFSNVQLPLDELEKTHNSQSDGTVSIHYTNVTANAHKQTLNGWFVPRRAQMKMKWHNNRQENICIGVVMQEIWREESENLAAQNTILVRTEKRNWQKSKRTVNGNSNSSRIIDHLTNIHRHTRTNYAHTHTTTKSVHRKWESIRNCDAVKKLTTTYRMF